MYDSLSYQSFVKPGPWIPTEDISLKGNHKMTGILIQAFVGFSHNLKEILHLICMSLYAFLI